MSFSSEYHLYSMKVINVPITHLLTQPSLVQHVLLTTVYLSLKFDLVRLSPCSINCFLTRETVTFTSLSPNLSRHFTFSNNGNKISSIIILETLLRKIRKNWVSYLFKFHTYKKSQLGE